MVLIFWAKPSTISTRASIPTAALTLLGSLAFCCLSYAEHVNSVQPSTILNVYLFLSLLFDIARSRTLWLQHYNNTLAALLTATIAIKIPILVLEAWNKRRILRPEYQVYPPEAISGIISRLFFWWQLPLFRQGYSETLTVNDLFPLDKHLSSSYLQTAMQLAWMKGLNTLIQQAPLLNCIPRLSKSTTCSHSEAFQHPTLPVFKDAKVAIDVNRVSSAVSHRLQLLSAVLDFKNPRLVY